MLPFGESCLGTPKSGPNGNLDNHWLPKPRHCLGLKLTLSVYTQKRINPITRECLRNAQDMSRAEWLPNWRFTDFVARRLAEYFQEEIGGTCTKSQTHSYLNLAANT